MEVKLEKSTEATTSISNQRKLCLNRFSFQSCLYTHWKSAYNRSILPVIIDSQLYNWTESCFQDDNRKDRISWTTNKVALHIWHLSCCHWGYWKTPNLHKLSNHRYIGNTDVCSSSSAFPHKACPITQLLCLHDGRSSVGLSLLVKCSLSRFQCAIWPTPPSLMLLLLYWSMGLFVERFSAVDTSNKIRASLQILLRIEPRMGTINLKWFLPVDDLLREMLISTLFCGVLWSQFESSGKQLINIGSEEKRENVKCLPWCTKGSCVWVWCVGKNSDLLICCGKLKLTAVEEPAPED